MVADRLPPDQRALANLSVTFPALFSLLEFKMSQLVRELAPVLSEVDCGLCLSMRHTAWILLRSERAAISLVQEFLVSLIHYFLVLALGPHQVSLGHIYAEQCAHWVVKLVSLIELAAVSWVNSTRR
jgi:hypothetical protein